MSTVALARCAATGFSLLLLSHACQPWTKSTVEHDWTVPVPVLRCLLSILHPASARGVAQPTPSIVDPVAVARRPRGRCDHPPPTGRHRCGPAAFPTDRR